MKKWVKALRSGDYKQGSRKLVDDNDNFCCLGVLCNIAPNSVRGEWVNAIGGWEMYDDSKELNEKVRDWSGVQHPMGYIPSMNSYLTELNDYVMNFEEIADMIEKHYEEL